MKKQKNRKINFKKLTIATVHLKKMNDGHVNPPPVTEEENCLPTQEQCIIDKLF